MSKQTMDQTAPIADSAYSDGITAYHDGAARTSNPYAKGWGTEHSQLKLVEEWYKGYDAARKANK